MTLLDIATYLASVTNKVVGVNVFYEAIPPTPDLVIVVREPKAAGYINPQLQCDLRSLQIVVRSSSGVEALNNAILCHKALVHQNGDVAQEPTGLILIATGILIRAEVQGNPIYDSIDDKGRRLYKFNVTIITNREY